MVKLYIEVRSHEVGGVQMLEGELSLSLVEISTNCCTIQERLKHKEKSKPLYNLHLTKIRLEVEDSQKQRFHSELVHIAKVL
jgi:hypothetical protein